MELGVFRASIRRGHASNAPKGCRLGLSLSSGRLEKLHRERASQGGCRVGPGRCKLGGGARDGSIHVDFTGSR
uniref:Uncharacterized protein n=1 Tax=Oryza barthii TaxID=65489 RepID=A0A0D3HL14_9ORYZ